MSNKDCIYLAYKNIKKSNIRRNIFILVISLFLIIVLIPFTVYKVFLKALDLTNELSDSKTVIVYKALKSNIDYIKSYNNKNIIKVDYNYQLIPGYIDYETNKNIYIFEAIDKHTPKIIKGKKELLDFEMLCPTYMAYGVFDFLTYDDLTKTKIGDAYTLNFYKEIPGENEEPKYEKYEYDFHIASQFDAANYYNYNTCYVNSNTYNKIKEIFIENQYGEDIYIYAKDRASALQICSELSQKGMDAFVSTPDTYFMKPLLYFGIVLIIFISVASFITVLVYFYSYFKSEYKRLALYKSLGYSYKEIMKIMLAEIDILIFISFIIDLFLFIITAFGLELILKQQVRFSGVYIRLPIIPFIMYFVILIIMSAVLIKDEAKKIKNLTVRELNEE
ncbi:MAG: ABC transporter permease [Bacilli bacterium]|nr:ABC transporter permease [Bacilli bacterium]